MRFAWGARLLAACLGAVIGGVIAFESAPAYALLAGTVNVSTHSHLNVRTGPSTSYPVVRSLADGSRLVIVCQLRGQRFVGTERTTDIWDRLRDGRYVSDAFVAWPGHRPAVPWCGLRATARVSTSLNQRKNASTLLTPYSPISGEARLSVSCQLGGESVSGTSGRTSLWDRLSNGLFVADAFVGWPGGHRPSVPWCVLGTGPAPAAGTAFVKWAAPYAKSSMKKYRVPASVTLAQSILESGWGRSSLSTDGNAYFGMKCFGTPGKIALGCRPYQTHECANTCYETSASFRVYGNVAASFNDHGYQLATLSRYRKAFAYSNDPDRFALELQRAGYATSKTYAANLIGLMKKYDLYRYDGVPVAA